MIADLQVQLCRPFGRLARLFAKRAECGHKTARYNLVIDGEIVRLRGHVHHERCPDCGEKFFRDTAVRCCLCNEPVLFGAPVVHYKGNLTEEEISKVGSEAVEIDGGYIGCLNVRCADGAEGFAGIWNGHEILEPVLS